MTCQGTQHESHLCADLYDQDPLTYWQVIDRKYESFAMIEFEEDILFSKIEILVPLQKSENFYDRYKRLCIETEDERGTNIKEYCWKTKDHRNIVKAKSNTFHRKQSKNYKTIKIRR